MEQQQQMGRFTSWAVLGIVATVATTVAAGTWMVSRTYLQDELEQYRRSVEWKLPENLQQLGELSKQLSLTIADRRELDELRGGTKALKDETASLQARLKVSEDAVLNLTKRIGELEGDAFEVRVGEAHVIVPGYLAIGVKDTNTASHEAQIQFGKIFVVAKPGTPLEATIGDVGYTVTLLKIDVSSCSFAVSKRSVRR